MFGPSNVGELIVGTTAATETTVATFVATAPIKSVKVLSKTGGNVAAGVPFYVLQSTDGDATKSLDFEFSDVIDPKRVDKVTVKEYAPEVAKSLKVDGFSGAGVLAAGRTYEVEIRLEDELSPENFTTIQGYYVTGEVLGTDTATTVRDGVLLSLNKNLQYRGNSEFTAVANGTGISVTEKIQNNVPGKIDGRKLRFNLTGKVFNNVSNGYNSNLQLLTTTVLAAGSPGNGTGKFATNFEYFVKGYKYDPANAFNWETQFSIPFYTTKAGIYNVIQIKYHAVRNETIIERQPKVLTILMDKVTNVPASNAATNAILADLRTAIGTYATVPPNLAVV